MLLVNWPTRNIFVPKVDTVAAGVDPVTGREIRTYDTVALFHKQLRAAEVTADGRGAHLTTHSYGATQYAPDISLINNFTVEFEDGTYRVVLVGSNNNIAERAVVNSVSIQPGNSAGLQIVATGSGVTAQDKTDITAGVWAQVLENGQTAAELQRIKLAMLAGQVTGGNTPVERFYAQDGVTVRAEVHVDANGNRSLVVLDGS